MVNANCQIFTCWGQIGLFYRSGLSRRNQILQKVFLGFIWDGACCLCTVSSAAQFCLLHRLGSNEATEVWSFLKNGKNVQFSMSAKKAILGLRWARAVCALSRPNLDSVCCCCCCSGLGLGMLGLRMRLTHQKSQVDPATQFGRGTPPGHNTILRLGSLEKNSIFLWFLGNFMESGGSEN